MNYPHQSISVLVVIAIAASTFPAWALDNDDLVATNQTRRPIEELFKTDVVFPEEKGELETEVVSVYQNHRGGDTWTIPLSLEFGLTDNWQVEAEWDCYVRRGIGSHSLTVGIGDLEIGTQYSFLNIGGSLFHVSPLFSIGIPLGDVNKDLSEGFLEYEPAVVVARDFPQLHHTELFTEIGASFVQRVNTPSDADDREPAAHELRLGAGFFTLFQHGATTFEFNWANNKWNHHGTENDVYVTPGYLWKPIPHFEFGLGIPVGLNHSSDRFEVIAHVTLEF
jgi:hypothetical protein